MDLNDDIRNRIQDIIQSDRVVLFMKGTKNMPQCGFSANVISILSNIGVSFTDVNVLEDNKIREGIKIFSDWPTIPQIYLNGEFQGGADIIRDLYASGEIYSLFQVDLPEPIIPQITISDRAKKALQDAHQEEEAPYLRLEIDHKYNHHLSFSEKNDKDTDVNSNGINIILSPQSTHRAEGLSIDFEEGLNATGFKMNNPNNSILQVKDITVTELKQKWDNNEALDLFDVRGEDERVIAKIDFAKPLDSDAENYIKNLSKDSPLIFHCHHGGRSTKAAKHYMKMGYNNVFNLKGGIQAWSEEIDPSIPQY